MQYLDNPTLILGSNVSFDHIHGISNLSPFGQGGIPLSSNMLPSSPMMVSIDWNDLVDPHFLLLHPSRQWMELINQEFVEVFQMKDLLILWQMWEVLTSTCKSDETRIFWEAKEALKCWIITLGDKSTHENISYRVISLQNFDPVRSLRGL